MDRVRDGTSLWMSRKALTQTIWGGAVLFSALALIGTADAAALKADEINQAKIAEAKVSRAAVAKLQILLDRAGYSPGVIDGRFGENVENALEAFEKQKEMNTAPKVSEEVSAKLEDQVGSGVIVEYTISEADVKGPFTAEIPDDFEAKKNLDRLGYRDPAELLAEKFHMDEDFLKELNPNADFGTAGTKIMVANVQDGEASERRVARIEAYTKSKRLLAFGDDGKLVAFYPATVGSEARPAPRGKHTIKGVAENPKYTYDPRYQFEGVKTKKPFTIAAGPNNPVGAVWIDLSGDGYGIHGTPDPAEVGKTGSHGCVRLTNWDAVALSKMVRPGVKVEFMED